MRITLKYITLAAAALVVTHLAASAVMSAITAHLYDHRMINVRHLDSHQDKVPNLIAAFLQSHRDGDKPKVLITGSSFSWGYSWPEKGIFSWHLQQLRPDLDVINASAIGYAAYGTVDVLCLAHKAKLKYQTVVVEINLSNTRTAESRRCSGLVPLSLGRFKLNSCARVSIAPPLPGMAYFSFFATTPFGLSNLRMIRDEYNYEQPERKFSFGKLPDDYFLAPQEFDRAIPNLEELFSSLAEAGAHVSEDVIVLISPIATEGVRRSQFDPQEVQRQQMVLQTLCEKQPKLRCLPLQSDLPLEYFGNLTHLNLSGHAFYGRYFAGEIAEPISVVAPQKDAIGPVRSEPRPISKAASMTEK